MTGWISNAKIKRSSWKPVLFRFRTKRTFIIECLSSGPGRWSPWLFRLGRYRLYFSNITFCLSSFSNWWKKFPIPYQEDDLSELTSLLRHTVIALAEASVPFDGPIIIFQELRWVAFLDFEQRHGLWLENEGVTPNCDYKGSCNSWGPVQREVWKRYVITQF